MTTGDPISAFVKAACVPLDSGHASGNLDEANRLLAAHPDIGTASIFTAAILGDSGEVREAIALDRAAATAKGGAHGWDPLTYLCFSRYLAQDPARSSGFVDAATALLDAGASANTGFYEPSHQPQPALETVLYGAAGVAHHPELTRLLLQRGADPNDGEVAYHAPESDDNRALILLVESGKMTPQNLAMMLVRKHDWHDYDGAKYLLEHGVSPNGAPPAGWQPFHHAIKRDNSREMIALVLDHGGDPERVSEGMTVTARAAVRGRADVLRMLEEREFPLLLEGAGRLIAACALNDSGAVRATRAQNPGIAKTVLGRGGDLISIFAGNGNIEGIRLLVDLGVPVNARYRDGDGYWGIAPQSTALHVAAWRAEHATVKGLLALGADVHAKDQQGRTPLALAVKACVNSYWTWRRAPDSVRALLAAGAAAREAPFPTGYEEVDALLEAAR